MEEIHYGKEGRVTQTYTYKYDPDKKGNWIRQKKMQDGKLIEIEESIYRKLTLMQKIA